MPTIGASAGGLEDCTHVLEARPVTEAGDGAVIAPGAALARRKVNGEALSVGEKHQPTHAALQSLNAELTVLNLRLQETLAQARTTATDLQNVLCSTQQATLFLDPQLCIRFFTPATRAVFSVLSGVIGRPLADLRSLAVDAALLDDAAAVLAGAAPRMQEITTAAGAWFLRRVLPYRAQDATVAGVVITFADITARRRAAALLEAATRRAELASLAQSRCLSAASHDLRQPLQTLTLLRDLLAKAVEGDAARKLVAMLNPALATMAGMLDRLRDNTQTETGSLSAALVAFPINPLLRRLAEEFGHLASGQGLELRLVPCRRSIRSDPRLLEQLLRSLLSNALQHTSQGRILLGCRRRAGGLRIEVWDTGIGIPDRDNAAAEPDLGLSIAQRLAGLLGHALEVQGKPGRGSVFAIALPLALPAPGLDMPGKAPPSLPPKATTTLHVVEDDAEARAALMRVLAREGQQVIGHPSAEAFLAAYRAGGEACLLVDAQLPGMSGFDLLAQLRQAGDPLPAIMVTGFSDVGAAVQAMKCGASDFIEKPVRAARLRAALAQALAQSRDLGKLAARRQKAADSMTTLTSRQRQVMTRVLAGEPSKNIAADLGISQRTVETHRAEIMRRTGAKSLPALARLALAAEEQRFSSRP